MRRTRFAIRAALAAGLFFLAAAPSPTRGQNNPSNQAPTPLPTPPAARPRTDNRAPDDFAGLTFTAEQQAKVRRIHQDFRTRREVVVKDEKLSEDQKRAMLEGFGRMENGEVFKILTPEQQKKARENALARRTAAKEAQEKEKKSSPN